MKQIATQVRLHSLGQGEGGKKTKQIWEHGMLPALIFMFLELSSIQEYILSGMCGAWCYNIKL